MILRKIVLLSMAICALTLTHRASAQTVVTEWAFDNNPIAINTSPATSTGSGTASTLGLGGNGTGTNYNPTQAQPTDTSDINTSTPTSSDPAGPSQWRIRGGDGTASPGAGSNAWSSNAPIGAQGAQFLTATTGFNNVQVSFDWSPTSQGEGKLQVQYTINGSTYLNVPLAMLSAGTSGVTLATNTSSANTVMGGYIQSSAAVYYNGITANLGSIAGVSNDPNFGIRLVSAATGADDVNATGAALNNTSGNWRFDAVTISGATIATGVPEPGAYVIGSLALAVVVFVVARRRAA